MSAADIGSRGSAAGTTSAGSMVVVSSNDSSLGILPVSLMSTASADELFAVLAAGLVPVVGTNGGADRIGAGAAFGAGAGAT